MINRDKQPIQVVSFVEGKDAYGRVRKNGSTSRQSEMTVKIYSQSKVDDIRYVDVTHIGITADEDITDSNQIIIDDNTYQVLYVIPSHRFNQVLMKKV